MRLLYTIGIMAYTLGLRIAAALGHSKALLMVQGWKRREEALRKLDPQRPTVWFHAASLGEFEQARPVLEAYRLRHPDHQVLLTFFSPSGYEVRRNYPQAEAVCYLPMDTPHNARQFIGRVAPCKAFFVKYEFWFNYLGELHRRQVDTYIFSAIFRPGQYFFKPWGHWFLRQIGKCYTHLFVQNEESLRLLQTHGIAQCSTAGDTRFDRVHQIATSAASDAVAERFVQGGNAVLVCGSTWPPDEQLLATARQEAGHWFPDRIIIAPHQINEEHLQHIEQLFPDSVRYSRYREGSGVQTLIVDNIGLLSRLYRYATVAYIGGGFGAGIHNILEAVAFGKPVVFGPNCQKFQEAHDAIARGCGAVAATPQDLTGGYLHSLLSDPEAYAKAQQSCLAYMQDNLGSTLTILDALEH